MHKLLLAVIVVATLLPGAPLSYASDPWVKNYCEDPSEWWMHAYVGSGGRVVVVHDMNMSGDCNGDTVPADYDDHLESGVAGAILTVAQESPLHPGCALEAPHHGGTVHVQDRILGYGVDFLVGADIDCDNDLDTVTRCWGWCDPPFAPGADGAYWVYLCTGTKGIVFTGYGYGAALQSPPGEPLSTRSSTGSVCDLFPCSDGVDNDGDGWADHPADPQCSGPRDRSEEDNACSDLEDNDGDGRIDYPADPGCSGPLDGSEEDYACSDLRDNDGDGRIDYPADPGCSDPLDGSEEDSACSDLRDNDGDGRIDHPADPGCDGPDDVSEGPDPACSDSFDNDDDGFTDFPVDPGCAGPNDDSEGPDPECGDGRDNDDDGWIDHPADPGCTGPEDDSEWPDPMCSNGIDDDLDDDGEWPTDPDCEDRHDDSEGEPDCSDGVDNDLDGFTDHPADPGCDSETDRSEFPDPPACSDGRDNDGDGRIDHPQDPGCSGPSDTWEGPDPAGPPLFCMSEWTGVDQDPSTAQPDPVVHGCPADLCFVGRVAVFAHGDGNAAEQGTVVGSLLCAAASVSATATVQPPQHIDTQAVVGHVSDGGEPRCVRTDGTFPTTPTTRWRVSCRRQPLVTNPTAEICQQTWDGVDLVTYGCGDADCGFPGPETRTVGKFLWARSLYVSVTGDRGNLGSVQGWFECGDGRFISAVAEVREPDHRGHAVGSGVVGGRNAACFRNGGTLPITAATTWIVKCTGPGDFIG